ncbi:MAG: hypothetical protein EXS00_03990 [Phycisphaerales bacterium]|nr:hypothetical protein [Phycisphaerales bacterium]
MLHHSPIDRTLSRSNPLLAPLAGAVLIATLCLGHAACEDEEEAPVIKPQPVQATAADYNAVMGRLSTASGAEAKMLTKAATGSGFSDADETAYWQAHNDRIAALTEISGVLRGRGVRKPVSEAFDNMARVALTEYVAAAGKYAAAKKAGKAASLGSNPNPPPAGSPSESMIELSTIGQWNVNPKKS